MIFVVKLIAASCRWTAAAVCSGCLLFTFHLLFQGVTQRDGEGLTIPPETAEEVQSRLQLASALLAVGFGGSLVFQAGGALSRRRPGRFLSRVREAVFGVLFFWAGACLFFCLLIVTASTQARWEVAGAYYWLAGALGALALLLFGTAGVFAKGAQDKPAAAASGGPAARLEEGLPS